MERSSRILAIAPCLAMILASCASSSSRVNWVEAPRPAEAQQFSDFLVGRYASLTNDPANAAENFERAAEREPNDPVLLERAVFSLLLSGDADGAMKLLDRVRPDNITTMSLTRLARGVNDIRKDDFASAQIHLNTFELGPFNRVLARTLAAWAAQGEGDFEQAQQSIVESLVGDTVLDGVSLNMLGFLQLANYKDEQALSTFEAVWNERMRLAVAAEAYARLLVADGKRDKALGILQQYRREVGPNPDLDLLARQVDAGDDIEVWRPAVKEGAALSLYSLSAALAAETRGDISGVYFALALELDPDLHIARSMLGNVLGKAGRRDEALEVLENIPADSTHYAMSRGQMAWLLRQLERNNEALETASYALEQSNDRDLRIQLGDLYRSLERHTEAEALFNQVVTEDEAQGRLDWRTYYARAITRSQLDRWAEAEEDFLKALEIDPTRAQVLNYLGYSWVDRGENLEEAFRLIRKAVDLEPNSGYIVDSLGWAYFRLGRYEEAVRYLERAVELSPGDPVLTDHLGDAYYRAGRKLEASFQWRQALNLEPDDYEIPRIELKLAEGLDSAINTTLVAADVPAPVRPQP